VAVGVITESERDPVSVFYCTTSGLAFGPVFQGDKDSVSGFALWMREEKRCPDPRRMDVGEIGRLWADWEELPEEQRVVWIEKAY
jgi:hypothetical protein